MSFWLRKSKKYPFHNFQINKGDPKPYIKEKGKTVEGATVAKFQNKVYKLWYILYFCAPEVKQGAKRSRNLQGTQIFKFGPLLFSQNKTNFEKPTKNAGFGLNFGHFWRFFNSDWKVAAQTLKFEFLEVFASFDTPLDPRGVKVKNEMIREANTPVCRGFHQTIKIRKIFLEKMIST